MINEGYPNIALIAGNNYLTRELVNQLNSKGFRIILITDKQNSDGLTLLENLQIYPINKASSLDFGNVGYLICVTDYSLSKKLENGVSKKDKEKIRLTRNLASRFNLKDLVVYPYINEEKRTVLLNDQDKKKRDETLLEASVHVGDIVPPNDLQQWANNKIFRIFKNLVINGRGVFESEYYYLQSPEKTSELIIRNLFSLKSYGKKTAVLGKPLSSRQLSKIIKGINDKYELNFQFTEQKALNINADEIYYTSDDGEELLKETLQKFVEYYGNKGLESVDIESDIKTGSGRLDGLKTEQFERVVSDVPAQKISDNESRNGKFRSKLNNFILYLSENLQLRRHLSTKGIKTVSVGDSVLDNKLNGLTAYSSKNIVPLLSKSRHFWIRVVLLLVILFIVLPFIFVLVSSYSLVIAKTMLDKGNIETTRKLINTSLVISRVTGKYSGYLKDIKVIGYPYKLGYNLSNTLQLEGDIGIQLVDVINETFGLSSLGAGGAINTQENANNLALDLGYFYEKLGFLDSEIKSFSPVEKRISSIALGDIDLSKTRKKILALQNVTQQIPFVLGKDTPFKYLFLFQNDSISRPTGGVISSYALATFSSGKLVSLEVEDVATADNKLKGEVEPPQPLTKYLNLTNWSLADSNWDPDYAQSARRAEWFVDKELNESFDGVITINGTFITQVLKLVGPVQVDGRQISDFNFYNFINGNLNSDLSDKNNGQLYSDLVENVYQKTLSLSEKDKLQLFKLLYYNLNQKNIQVYSHEDGFENALTRIGWSGIVEEKQCVTNCYNDLISIVESSLNEGSIGIDREAEYSVSFEEGLIKRKYVIFYKNNQPFAYKTYLRLLGNPDSGFSLIEIVDNKNKIQVDPEVVGVKGRKEAGVYLEVPAQSTKAVVFTWESPQSLKFDEEGEYRIYIWKQPGIYEYPVSIKLKTPGNTQLFNGDPLTLTLDGYNLYNTQLFQDKLINIKWSQDE